MAAKFFSRLFSGGSSSSKRQSIRGSQTSINEAGRRTGTAGNIRAATSLDNISSYHVNPKELEKNKLHKASWEGNLQKVERLAGPGQINMKDQHLRVIKFLFLSNIFRTCCFFFPLNRLHCIWLL
jgi:hypothetical protein